MLVETELYNHSERYFIDRAIIDEVALPIGDRYGDDVFTDYLSDYAGVAKKFKPKRIFEIGVRYGYTAISMVLGARANRGAPKVSYLGIDDESYHAGSCDRANQNFAKICPGVDMRALRYNSITQGVPPDIGTFDMISIDGNHDYQPVLGDLYNCWPLLNPGGIIQLDDAAPGSQVREAIEFFLSSFDGAGGRVEFQWVPNIRTHCLIRKCE